MARHGAAVVAALAANETVEDATLLALRRLGPRASPVAPQLVELIAASEPQRAPALYEALAEVLPLTQEAPKQLRGRLNLLTHKLIDRCDEQAAMAIRRGFVRVSIRINTSGAMDPSHILGHIRLNARSGASLPWRNSRQIWRWRAKRCLCCGDCSTPTEHRKPAGITLSGGSSRSRIGSR